MVLSSTEKSAQWLASVCVFCSARDGTDPRFLELATATGEALARQNFRLVYGGSRDGMMGRVADGCLAQGGQVLGVLPGGLFRGEISHPGLQELRMVESMAVRKDVMFSESDSFLVLPGGMGTLDELFEAITWNALGLMQKPLFILDPFDFYSPLIAWLEKVHIHGFAAPPSALFQIVRSLEEWQRQILR